MASLEEIRPHQAQRVMDLVKRAGVDVSDWKNFKGGQRKAAANPKFCYEWSFVESEKLVVLNLWFESMQEEGGTIFQKISLRNRPSESSKNPKAVIWRRRAQKMDRDIQHALVEGLLIRVIVCDGKMRDAFDARAVSSKVSKRLLDPTSWGISSYDFDTGECVLIRGGKTISSQEIWGAEYEGFEGEERKLFVLHRRREGRLRREKIEAALKENTGKLVCEVPNCGFDFSERYGVLGQGYAQVHHLEPLNSAPKAGRKTTLSQLAIVCANCHAMIHRGGKCRDFKTLISSLHRFN